jgi:hypothetical protein
MRLYSSLIFPGDDRAGRRVDTLKTECGLHLK